MSSSLNMSFITGSTDLIKSILYYRRTWSDYFIFPTLQKIKTYIKQPILLIEHLTPKIYKKK